MSTQVIAANYARKSTEQVGRDRDDKSVTRQVENSARSQMPEAWRVDDAHIYIDDAISLRGYLQDWKGLLRGQLPQAAGAAATHRRTPGDDAGLRW